MQKNKKQYVIVSFLLNTDITGFSELVNEKTINKSVSVSVNMYPSKKDLELLNLKTEKQIKSFENKKAKCYNFPE